MKINRVYLLCMLSVGFHIHAMNSAGSVQQALSIKNTDQNKNNLLLVIKNDQTIRLIKDWQQSGKSYNDWMRAKYGKNEEQHLLADQNALHLILEIEKLKNINKVTVESFYKQDINGDDFDKKYKNLNYPDAPLIIAVKADIELGTIAQQIQKMPTVAETILGTPHDIEKQVVLYQDMVVRNKTFWQKLRCVSGTAVAAHCLGVGVGILGTWLYMQHQSAMQIESVTACQINQAELDCFVRTWCGDMSIAECISFWCGN